MTSIVFVSDIFRSIKYKDIPPWHNALYMQREGKFDAYYNCSKIILFLDIYTCLLIFTYGPNGFGD